MRLIRKDGEWKPHFTVVWEVETLTDATQDWIPFRSATQPVLTGWIHAQTHEIRFDGAEPQTANIVVTLAYPQQAESPTEGEGEDGERER